MIILVYAVIDWYIKHQITDSNTNHNFLQQVIPLNMSICSTNSPKFKVIQFIIYTKFCIKEAEALLFYMFT